MPLRRRKRKRKRVTSRRTRRKRGGRPGERRPMDITAPVTDMLDLIDLQGEQQRRANIRSRRDRHRAAHADEFRPGMEALRAQIRARPRLRSVPKPKRRRRRRRPPGLSVPRLLRRMMGL